VRKINEGDRKPGKSWLMVKDADGNLMQVFGPTPKTGWQGSDPLSLICETFGRGFEKMAD
jgi:hypothetical protein